MRHDPPAVKGIAIGTHRILTACPAGNVVERRRRKYFLRLLLQKRKRDRNGESAAGQAERIDLLLALRTGRYL